MTLRGLILILTSFWLPQMALCQTVRQETKSLQVPVKTQLKNATPKTLRYLRSGGGDSGGGGAGVLVGNALRLKDFAPCASLAPLKGTMSKPVEERISDHLSKLEAASVKEVLKSSVKVSDRIFERMIWAAAARANWYMVNASLTLDSDADSKLAVFKRPIGIVLDKNLVSKLSPQDLQGLFFHESLRMVSLGFEIPLATEEIEQITCDAFSGKDLDVKKYPHLAKYMNQILGSENGPARKAREDGWATTYEAISNLQDLSMAPRGGLSTMFYQLESSKFETLRRLSPTLSSEDLELAFFGWAAQESPAVCRTEAECGYFEVWPAEPLVPRKRSLRRWNLILNDGHKLAWRNAETGTAWMVSKDDLAPEKLEGFCSQVRGAGWTVVREEDLRDLHSFPELSLVVQRQNLNSMESEAMPFLAKKKAGGYLLWAPDERSAGYNIINDSWSSDARAMCVQTR